MAYIANPVVFDGTNDYASMAAGYTGAADSNQWLLAASILFTGTAADQHIASGYQTANLRYIFSRLPGDTIFFGARTSAASTILNCTTPAVSQDVWHSVIFSKNGTTLQCSVDDTLVTLTENTNSAGNIGFAHNQSAVGAQAAAFGNKFNGQVADLWMQFGTSLDLSVEANRRKFFNSNNYPADKGAFGQYPLGESPIAFYTGPTDSWHVNKGFGGGLTLTGALTDGTAIPGVRRNFILTRPA